MKNHAFLFLVHKQPELLGRILRVLEKDNHYFFINVDAKTPDFGAFQQAADGVANVFFLKERVGVHHAGITTTLAELALLQAARATAVTFDYYHLLSGQDYPLRSNEQFDAFFETTDHSFMYANAPDVAKVLRKTVRRHINEYHFNDSSTRWAKLYESSRLGTLLSWICPRSRVENLTGGWQWFSWHAQVADYVWNYLEEHPEYLQRFNHTISADEHIFVSMLTPQAERLKIEMQNPLRYISWHPRRPVKDSYRPFVFNEEDLDYILDSAAFFCRKVDAVESARLLDLIDARRGESYDVREHTVYV